MQKITRIAFLIALFALLTYSGYVYITQPPKTAETVFTTLDGTEISMTSLKGKVVLVNFWATTCQSCVEEMPDLINTYYEYKDKGLEIIAVAMPYDPPAQVLQFANVKQLPFPVMHDGFAEVTKQFGDINVTPTTYIFNKNGDRIQRAIGTINFDKLHRLLNEELS